MAEVEVTCNWQNSLWSQCLLQLLGSSQMLI